MNMNKVSDETAWAIVLELDNRKLVHRDSEIGLYKEGGAVVVYLDGKTYGLWHIKKGEFYAIKTAKINEETTA